MTLIGIHRIAARRLAACTHMYVLYIYVLAVQDVYVRTRGARETRAVSSGPQNIRNLTERECGVGRARKLQVRGEGR